MNKSDVESLAYILSSSRHLEEATERILKLDERLPEEFEGFVQVEEADAWVVELYEKEMEKRFGKNWSFSRDARKADTKAIWDECKKKIYPEDEDELA